MSEASSMDRRVGPWRPHETRGWICRACGHHAEGTTSRLVHERRADRGLGCAGSTQPNRELLELAAKAAGVTIKYEEGCVTASLASGEFVKMMLRTPEAKADPEGAAAAALSRLLQAQAGI